MDREGVAEDHITGGPDSLHRLRVELARRRQLVRKLEGDLHRFHARLTQLVGDTFRFEEWMDGGSRFTAAESRNGGIADRKAPFRGHIGVGPGRSGEGAAIDDRDLKELYRVAARRAHPDRSADEVLRAKATRMMAEINMAYDQGNRSRLIELLRDLEDGADPGGYGDPNTWHGDTAMAIAVTEAALAEANARIDAICTGTAYRLMRQFDEVARVGRDPFKGLVETLRARFGPETPAVDNPEPPLEGIAGGDPQVDASTRFERDWLGERRYPSRRAIMMRSRSLVVIADVLDDVKLEWRYEHPIVGTIAPGILRPDFVFFDSVRTPIVIEHYGYAVGAATRSVVEARREWFEANGLASGLRYFMISDRRPDEPDLEHLRKVIEFIGERLGASESR